MGRPPRLYYQGAIYHAIARGNSRQRLFFDPADYDFFFKIMMKLKSDHPFTLHAYCLMPNHCHLLIEPLNTNLSTLMAILLNRYAKYFNRKFQKVGHVFQDRFKAPLCSKDAYLKELVRYIHLNPVRAELAVNPADWPFSSHRDYTGESASGLVDQTFVLSMLDEDPDRARAIYSDFVKNSAEINGGRPIFSHLPGPPPNTKGHPAASMREALRGSALDSGRTSLDSLRKRCEISDGPICLGICGPSRTREVSAARRKLMAHALRDGYSLTEIAAYLNISLSAVSRACSKSQASQVSQ